MKFLTFLRRLGTIFRQLLRGPLKVTDEKNKRKALLCYLQQPFRTRSADHLHSNRVEARVIVSILHEHGWNVDVIDFNSEYPIHYEDYDLVIGFGRAFERSFYSPRFSGRRILFMTGANPKYSNKAEIARLIALQLRYGKLLIPRRSVFEPFDASFAFCEAIFCIGNDWTLSTFTDCSCPIYRLPVPYVPLKHDIELRDFSEAARHFLWFGSAGAVHKGLDLLLEAFRVLPEYHLHVCGPVQSEEDFFSLYRADLLTRENVHFHGLVDVNSPDTADLFRSCAFTVLPSCSEGSSSSVITAMSTGLVPIVTEESGVDIGTFGILIKNLTIQEVINSVEKAVSLTPDDIRMRSVAAREHASHAHSWCSYKAAFSSALTSTITIQ